MNNHPPAEESTKSTPVAETTIDKQERRAENSAMLNRGVRWLIAGIALLLGSFVLTFLLYHAGISFTTTMYTLNIGGGICVFKGMMDILGF